MQLKFTLLLFLSFLPYTFWAQTCCSGGVPVSTNLGFNRTDAKTLQYNLAFNHNQLSSLYTGSEKLDDDSRIRTTQSYIFRTAYQFNDEFSFELFIPFIRQRREIEQLGSDIEESFGLGDIIIMPTYSIGLKSIDLGLSFGVKLPTGSNTEVNSSGFLLVNDLQPGSVAVDFIIRASLNWPFQNKPSRQFFSSVNLSLKGTNDNYLGSLSYKFGNEQFVIFGFRDEFILGSSLFQPSLGLRYRKAGRDLVNNETLESTGGEWLFLMTSVGIPIGQNHSVTIGLELPAYSFVNATQLSPDYLINISFFSNIKFK